MPTNLSLFATSLSFDLPKLRRKHPNRLPFRGVLTVIDAPSDRAPSGAEGHRVMIPRAVAEAALPSLLGMALDYTPTLDAHDSRRKIGMITGVTIDGRNLRVNGHIFARDFPEVADQIRRAPRNTFNATSKPIIMLGPSRSKWTNPNRVAARVSQPGLAISAICKPHPSSTTPRNTSGVAATSCSPPLQWWGSSHGNPSPRGATAPITINAITAAAQTSTTIRAYVEPPAPPLINPRPLTAATVPFSARSATENQRPLGMSYEIAEVQIVNRDAEIWVVQDFVFTGTAILRANRAAYQSTSIELEP